MIDHLSIPVSDFQTGRKFYSTALAPIGYKILHEGEGFCGMGPTAEGEEAWQGSIWLGQETVATPVHVAFRVTDRTQVDAFYQAALGAGGQDNGAPGIRARYHENYYAAFVHDHDGNNIEVVCHRPA